MAAKSIVLFTLSVFLGMFFIFVGSMKITPSLNREMHREIRRNFIQYAKVFPTNVLFDIKLHPRWYRLFVGWCEIVCGTILVLVPGGVKQVANVVLLLLCLGAVYTHVMLRDQFERMAPAIVFCLMLGCRLVVYYQVERKALQNAVKTARSRRMQDQQQQLTKEALGVHGGASTPVQSTFSKETIANKDGGSGGKKSKRKSE